MPDGTVINEKITVTGSEEDVTVLGHDTRIVFDYSKVIPVLGHFLLDKIISPEKIIFWKINRKELKFIEVSRGI